MMGAHPISKCWDKRIQSQSPAKGGQKVVHPAAAARTIVAVTFPPSFYYFCECVGFHAVDSKLL